MGRPPLHAMNDYFFSDINTEEKAYWLGFMAADGSVNKTGIVINLKDIDTNHLEKFKETIESTVNITIHKNNGFSGGETNIAHFGQWSPIMANDLFKLGFMFRKAHMIKPPKIKEHLQRHYWRGVIDGDGSISKRNLVRINSGSRKFLLDVKNLLFSIGIQSGEIRKEVTSFVLSISEKKNLTKLYNLLYKEAQYYYPRKKLAWQNNIFKYFR